MERTRVAKVDDVTLARRGEQVVGTLHLTPHHIIFSHLPPTTNNVQAQDTPARPKELWITYPIISFCTYRPTPAASRQPSSIRLRCRDFAFVCLYFASETKARDVYECIKGWTCKVGRIDKLYAFTYQPPPPERELNGWELYNPRQEWARQGIDQEGHGWRRYRSRARVPVLTYLHPINNCSITRSSQPLVGVRQNRSIQDEKLLAAIFSTSRSERPLAGITPAQLESESSSSTQGDISNSQTGIALTNAEEIEEEMLAFQGDTEQKPHVYGAQQHNLIVDARPTVNAFAMQAVGLGSENMDNYKFATKAYLGIDNIHVMRDSLNKVVDALKEFDVTPLGPNKDLLARSGWLKHISGILDGAGLIARQVGLQHSHVLIHCSDGWDRTSQLSALSQVCLDPYYRTMEGFMVLVEKDWLSFGHMFRHRSGHLNSDKWFQIENERIGGDSNRGFGDSGGAGKAIENAFLSAKGFFNRDNTSRDSLPDSEGEMQSYDSDKPGLKNPSPAPRSAGPEKEVTKVKETSPVFHQFLDATFQLLHQYPTRFEFNERFLRRLLYHLYSCQFGTFLFNSEKERVDWKAKERTRSVWDYFLARKEQFLNRQYDAVIDDHKRGKERLIFPRLNEVKWWSEAFGRTDTEMNGSRSASATAPISRDTSRARAPVLTGLESSHSSIGNAAKDRESPKAVAADMDEVSLGVPDLSFSRNKENGQASKTISQMEVEMQ
ncbi:phosphatidylinositol-3-phosphatase YMR1 [Aspergillus affinis]|uniref:phosphatidylinositol-3-phosphatase YMR1 n=1 Tax=Aspergillus affinis TaxID=1070780 RepID=UPI0022FE8CC6|nr:phosphatases II [Aspergillus affinis]KAI9045720.1 phosphatases II [Aspergillus affinis]